MPKSKWQFGGSMMLLLKLHPCVVTDKEKFSSQRKLHTNTPQWGRAGSSQRTRQVRASLPRHHEQDRQPCALASPEASTVSDYNLTYLNSQLSVNLLRLSSTSSNCWTRSLKLHSYTRHKHSDPTSHWNRYGYAKARYAKNMRGTSSRKEMLHYEVPCFQERFKSGEI